MQNISTLPLCQGRNSEEKNGKNVNNLASYGRIEPSTCKLSTVSRLEELSVAKAKETLRKMLLPTREAVQVFSNLEQLRQAIKISNERQAVKLPANITEAPKFHEAKSEPVELS